MKIEKILITDDEIENGTATKIISKSMKIIKTFFINVVAVFLG